MSEEQFSDEYGFEKYWQGYRAAIEDAAKVADEYLARHHSALSNTAAQQIGIGIRSLANKDEK